MPRPHINPGTNGAYTSVERVPPHNADAERAVLGSMAHDNRVIDRVIASLVRDDFYTDVHQRIFSAIADMHRSGVPVDLVTLADRLQGQIDEIGYDTIAELWDAAPTAANMEYYAGIVREAAVKRRVILLAAELAREAYDPSIRADDIAANLSGRVAGLSQSRETSERFRFNPVPSAQFFAAERRHVWVVKRLLVWGEPVVIGGPRKCLKTSLLLDLGISLASGTKFLGHFDVYRRMKVAILSGESGETTIEQATRRICFARGIDPQTLNIDWQFKLPKLPSTADLAELTAGLRRSGVEIVVIDPLYLCLLSGDESLDASSMFDVGPVLMRTAIACKDAGAMPALAHHSRKDLKPGEPMELEHLAFAGIQEFARQWILVNRRERFDADTGASRLFLSGGGSAGQSGEWYVDVTEGRLGEDFSGRRWEVSVTGAADGIEAAADNAPGRMPPEEIRDAPALGVRPPGASPARRRGCPTPMRPRAGVPRPAASARSRRARRSRSPRRSRRRASMG